MKKQALLFVFVSLFFELTAQVNLQTGSLRKSIPIYNYKGTASSNLNLNISLEYNSGNGLMVDQVASVVGTGWTLEGIPKIVRIQKGLPDDQQEISGSWNTFQRGPGYIYNNTSIDNGCPSALNYYPIFYEDGHTYYQDNKTTADREIDEFRLEIGGRVIPFVLDKNGGNCITLNNSKVKISIGGSTLGNISETPVTSIRGFTVTDEDGAIYDFGEAELYRSFVYNKDDVHTQCANNLFLKADDPINGPEYSINTWYVSNIKPYSNCSSNQQIHFDYITQIYDFKNIKPKSVSGANYSGPLPTSDVPCYQITITLPPPNNTAKTLYYDKLTNMEVRNYIEKKEIKQIKVGDNAEVIDFQYLLGRKDLTNVNALTQIDVSRNSVKNYSYLLTQKYFIKNEIKLPANADEEKWSRLCFTSAKKVSGDNTLEEKPFNFDYYTGSNNTEDFVAPPYFNVVDPFGYYNGDYSGVPTDRFLELNFADDPNWAKVCFHNYTALHGYPDEIIFNPKPNYARNGLLKSITYPTGGKEQYEYEQNYINPVIDNYKGLKYKSFSTRVTPGGITEYAYGGVSVSKIHKISIDGNIEKTISYDYSLTDGTSSRWGAEAGRVFSKYTYHYEPEHKVFEPFNCYYEFKYPGLLAQRPVTTTPKQLPTLAKYIKTASDIKTIWALLNGSSDPITSFIYSKVMQVVTSCGQANPEQTVNFYLTNYDLLNTNNLPSLFSRTKVTEVSATGVTNGSSVYEFTTPDDYPLLVPVQDEDLSNKPRGYYWMYGLPKKTTVFDNNAVKISEVTNQYSSNNNQVLTTSNTKSCNCESKNITSMRADDWLNPSTSTSYVSSTNTDLKVDFYNLVTGSPFLTSTKESQYKNSNFFETTTTFTQNTLNNQISKISKTDSKGTLIEVKNYYVDDYDLNDPGNLILSQMKTANLIDQPISSETWQTKAGGTAEMLTTSVNEFGVSPYGTFQQTKSYSLQTDKPVPLSIIGNFNPNQIIRNSTLIQPLSKATYDYWGAKEIDDLRGNRTKSFLYRNDGLPIATISNAVADDCCYITDANFTSNSIFFTKSNVNKQSKITFFANYSNKIKVAIGHWNGVIWVYNDLNPSISQNGLSSVYYEYTIPSGYQLQVRNDNACQMNEFRFYPANASMQTISYDVFGRKISDADINSHLTYYEYDGLSRLIKVSDENHNIIKTYEYHFKN